MKNVSVLIFLILSGMIAAAPLFAQEIPVINEQQLENLADTDQGETEDDNWLMELDHFRKQPVNLNNAGEEELRQLRMLTGLQIASLLSYRMQLGNLINLYELQAVPAWNLATIRKVLPYVTVTSAVTVSEEFRNRFSGGEHSLLLRVSQVLEKSNGFDQSTGGTKYLGSPQRFFFRYRYQFKNTLQFGLAGDKDAGEQFLKGSQKAGFDFYSFHLFARKLGVVQALALGDFTVNMGQGLIQWQSLAFKKSPEVMGIKRQSAVLRPYHSAGEFYFHRGVGVTVKKGNKEATVFASYRKLSANFVADTVQQEDFVSSFLSSGYHRTASEAADRNNLGQFAAGGTVSFKKMRWHAGANAVYYHFSLPVQKRNEPYNLYAINGRFWYNISLDYSYTFKNLHFFGEAAADRNFKKAFSQGILLSVDPKADLSILYRHISPGYQAVYGNAFTENTWPVNERGLYAGLSVRPAPGWRLDAYADIFSFPWLKYQADAPGYGTDFLIQVTCTPNKQTELYSRYRSESKQSNLPENNTPLNQLVLLPRQSWRTHFSYKIATSMSIRGRAELLWYDKRGSTAETGFLLFADFLYKPMLHTLSAGLRLQYFETDGYNSRIYAYENDVLYSYSIPGFFGKGFRYYANLSYDITRRLTLWLRLAQTTYPGGGKIGSGADEITGGRKTELKLQARWIF